MQILLILIFLSWAKKFKKVPSERGRVTEIIFIRKIEIMNII